MHKNLCKFLKILTGLPVQGRLELVDWGRDLQTGLKNGLLPLEPNVFGPSHESAQIPLRLNILTNLEVAGSGHEKGVLDPLNFGLLDSQGGGCDLLSLLLGLKLQKMFVKILNFNLKIEQVSSGNLWPLEVILNHGTCAKKFKAINFTEI